MLMFVGGTGAACDGCGTLDCDADSDGSGSMLTVMLIVGVAIDVDARDALGDEVLTGVLVTGAVGELLGVGLRDAVLVDEKLGNGTCVNWIGGV
jgi:hypothetical protein